MNMKAGGGHPCFHIVLSGRYPHGDEFDSLGNSLACSQMPMLGDKWKMSLRGNCIPKSSKNPRFVIPSRCLDDHRNHMRDHAFIWKCVGSWPTEKELEWWIQKNWKPKGEVDLRLGPKGFFTVIFQNLVDKAQIFESDPYFYNNAGLYIRHWEACFNLDNKEFVVTSVWVRPCSLPAYFWIP